MRTQPQQHQILCPRPLRLSSPLPGHHVHHQHHHPATIAPPKLTRPPSATRTQSSPTHTRRRSSHSAASGTTLPLRPPSTPLSPPPPANDAQLQPAPSAQTPSPPTTFGDHTAALDELFSILSSYPAPPPSPSASFRPYSTVNASGDQQPPPIVLPPSRTGSRGPGATRSATGSRTSVRRRSIGHSQRVSIVGGNGGGGPSVVASPPVSPNSTVSAAPPLRSPSVGAGIVSGAGSNYRVPSPSVILHVAPPARFLTRNPFARQSEDVALMAARLYGMHWNGNGFASHLMSEEGAVPGATNLALDGQPATASMPVEVEEGSGEIVENKVSGQESLSA
ncbi:hypothetical protein T439DRAFT_329136 [Meredithblackwellia eburnea MCA 4105]